MVPGQVRRALALHLELFSTQRQPAVCRETTAGVAEPHPFPNSDSTGARVG